MKLVVKKHLNIMILISFIIFSIISDIILIHTHVLFSTNDIQFHLKRVMELKYLISSRHLFIPVGLNYFHGSAVMGMYPYFNLLPLAIINFLIPSYIKSYYFFFMIIVFLSLMCSFWSSISVSKSRAISYVFSIMYSMSLLMLVNTFHDGDLGISTSLIFLPIVIFGFVDILNGNKNYYKLSLGIFLMSLCQLPATLITIILLIIWLIINIPFIDKKKLIFKSLCESILLFVLLSSIIWVPMIDILIHNNLFTPGNVKISLLQPGLVGIIKNVGIIALFCIPVSLIVFNKLNRYLKQMIILSILIIVFSSKMIPMGFITSLPGFQVINKFQFTSRFLIIPHILLCYVASYLLVRSMHVYISQTLRRKILFLVFIGVIIILQIMGQTYLVNVNFRSNYKFANSYKSMRMVNKSNIYMVKNDWIKYLRNGYMPNDDYYPREVKTKAKYVMNDKGYNNGNLITIKHCGNDSFKFYTRSNLTRVTLPILHYNNEHLRIYLNGHIKHFYVNRNRLITVQNIKKGNYKLIIKYLPNVNIMIMKMISFLCGIIWIMLLFIKRLNRIKL